MSNPDDNETTSTEKAMWKAVSTLGGAAAAVVTRQILGALWSRIRGDDEEPPLNPADRAISWEDALIWAIAAGVGSGIARLVGQRLAAAGWESATGSTPPGVQA